MEVLILTKQYTYLLREILNSGFKTNFAFKQKIIIKLLYPLPMFPVAVLLANLNLIIMPLLQDSCKEQLLCMFPLLASASVYIIHPAVATLCSSRLNLHDIPLFL